MGDAGGNRGGARLLTGCGGCGHNRNARANSAVRECVAVSPESEKKRSRASRLEDVGRRVDQEVEEFLRWFNDEAVPQIRQHSTRGLRKAAVKLSDLADYLDDMKQR